MAATVGRPYRPGAGIRKVTGDTWHGSTTRPVDPITGNPDEAINNDIATVRDAFKRYEAETGIDPATLPREQQREIALGGLNALDQSGVRSGDAVLRNGS